MSLNLQDLGLVDTVREIVGKLNSGHLIIVDNNRDRTNNPYELDAINPVVTGVYPLISFKDDTVRSRFEFGQVESGLYRLTIALNNQPIEIDDYCFINWSNGTRIIPMVIMRVENRLSSLVYITVDSKETVPFSWEEIKPLLEISS